MTFVQDNLEYDITLDISGTYCQINRVIIHDDISTLIIPKYIFKYEIKFISVCAFIFNYLYQFDKIKCVIIKNDIIVNNNITNSIRDYNTLFSCFNNLKYICINNILLRQENDKYIII